jgi:hypothetical protein
VNGDLDYATTRRRTTLGTAARVTVLIGPPAAGKSTYARTHAQPDDIVIDLDAIARALMPTPPTHTHTYPDHIRSAAIGARAEAIRRATHTSGIHVWLIHAMPSEAQVQQYQALGYELHVIDPGEDTVRARCATERPAHVLEHVDAWYAVFRTLPGHPCAP